MKLTLLGFSEVTTIVLTELAADALGIDAQNLTVEVICNIEQSADFIRNSWPLPHSKLIITRKRDWTPPKHNSLVMPGVMSAKVCQTVVEDFEASGKINRDHFGVIVHPSATIASSVSIKPGTWIHPNSCISSMTSIGYCVGVNRSASIGHHSVIGDFARINPGAHLGGSCTVELGATIGIGASCLENTTIGSGAMVGAGSVVTKNVLSNQTVVGIPAKPLPKI